MNTVPQNVLDHISECIEHGDVDSAEQAARWAVKTYASDAEAHNALGCVLYAHGDLPDACAAFDQAHRLSPGNACIARNLEETRRALDRASRTARTDALPGATEAPRTRPLRLLQAHTFYPSYLDAFYQRHPDLRAAPFAEQMRAILSDGFSSGHILTPALAELGYETMFVVANCIPLQARWLEESGLARDGGEYTQSDVLKMQIDAFQPDVLYMTNPVDYDSRFLRTLTWKPRLTLGWRAACVAPDTDWTSYDLILSHLRASRDQALRLGAREVAFFHPGLPTWIADAVADETARFDVVFSGQWTDQHARRNAYLLALADAADADPALSVAFYCGHENGTPPPEIERRNLGARWGIEMHRALRSGRIVVNAEIDLAQRDAGNMRLFEATGSGCFLLTEDHPNLRRFFEPGHEVETFRNEAELLQKVRYYLAHPDEREAIARRGLERCRTEYAVELRAAEFDRIVRARLGDSDVTSALKDARTDPHRIAHEAVDRANAGDGRVALDLFEKARSLSPTAAGLSYGHAFVLAKLGRSEDALEELRTLGAAGGASARQTRLLNEVASQPTAEAAPHAESRPTESGPGCECLDGGEAQRLYEKAEAALARHDADEAFRLVIAAKALRAPVRGLDRLRARCFLARGEVEAARASLREALRYFPDDAEAAQWLAEIDARHPGQAVQPSADGELARVLDVVRPYTMVKEERLASLWSLVRQVCEAKTPGNFVECGVAAGGSSALIASAIRLYSDRPRLLFSCDTFDGMPDPTPADTHDGVAANDTGWGAGTCSAGVDSLAEVCRKLGVQDLVRPVIGRFEETLPANREQFGAIAFLHLDGDWYESTLTTLTTLYDRIADGGILQIDDFGFWDGCRRAVSEFERQRGITLHLQPIDGEGVWCRKPSGSTAIERTAA